MAKQCSREQNRVPARPVPLCRDACCCWLWLVLAVVLRLRMLDEDEGNLLFPLAWQNVSLSAHILSGSQIDLLRHRIHTFVLTLTGRGKGHVPALLTLLVLVGPAVEGREGGGDVPTEPVVEENW